MERKWNAWDAVLDYGGPPEPHLPALNGDYHTFSLQAILLTL